MQVEAKAANDARNYAESRKLSYENAFLDTASRGYSDTVRAFVHHLGVSVGTVFNADSGRSALHNAAWKGNAAMVRLLVTELGGSVAVRCVRGRTPLLWAAFDGHAAVVRLLVTELGADASDRQPDGWTALHLAVANGHNEVIDLLVREFGVDVDERSTVASPFVSVTDSVNPSLALARLLGEHANGTQGPTVGFSQKPRRCTSRRRMVGCPPRASSSNWEPTLRPAAALAARHCIGRLSRGRQKSRSS